MTTTRSTRQDGWFICATGKAIQHFTLDGGHRALCNKSFGARYAPLNDGSGWGYEISAGLGDVSLCPACPRCSRKLADRDAATAQPEVKRTNAIKVNTWVLAWQMLQVHLHLSDEQARKVLANLTDGNEWTTDRWDTGYGYITVTDDGYEIYVYDAIEV